MHVKEFLDTNPNPIEPGYVFALIPERRKSVYQAYVEKAASSLGLRCESFLDLKHPGDALRDILARIQKAEILVFDISDFTPNVMWELGLALAVKDAERVIVIREKSEEPAPFDIYSHRVTFEYDPNSQKTLDELYKTLREVMQKINKASSRKAPIQSPEVKSLLDAALKAVERKEWIAAEALFQTMDAREPDNWYIYNQWGIMLRTKGELETANEKLNEALNHADFDDEKAFIYTEIAVLHQRSHKYTDAEAFFRKAEEADRENSRLYTAWAEYYDELGDYFSAQAKIGGALARIKQRKEDDPNYKELMLRHAYYERKIKSPSYTKSFDRFKREAGQSPTTFADSWQSSDSGLPYDISWADLVEKHIGAVVEGEISKVTELGIFVRLSREFTGLVFWKNLMDGFGEKFSKNERVKVQISKAFIHPKDHHGRIDLRLMERSGIVQPKPVLLSASAPRAVRPGASFAVRFAAYVKKHREEMEAQLTERSLDSQAHFIKQARWQIGTRVKVRLSSPHLSVLSPEEEFVWQGDKEMVEFQVQAPSTEIDTVLSFDISIGGISVAKFLLELRVSVQTIEKETTTVPIKPASSGFASYSSKDEQEVIARTEEIRRSGLDLWMDCLDLRPGQIWEAEIDREIRKRELFLLFWSANAKKSKWVQWEWKLALKEKGISSIEPHPLDDTKPPKELSVLNFRSPYLLIRKGLERSS